MNALFRSVVAAGMLMLIYGCKPEGAPIYRLGTPRFVAATEPDSVVEAGIGQDPATGGIFLQWYSAGKGAGYKIFRSDSLDEKDLPTGFKVVATVLASAGTTDTSAVDFYSLSTGVRYYYYVVAYAVDGSESAPSDTINYSLLDRPGLSYPGLNATVSKEKLYFTWHDYTGGGYTVIRVKDVSVIPAEYIWVSRRFEIFSTSPKMTFNFDSTASGELVSSHSYQWRVDRFSQDANEGARSVWQVFTIQ